jgi:hypothetical protein
LASSIKKFLIHRRETSLFEALSKTIHHLIFKTINLTAAVMPFNEIGDKLVAFFDFYFAHKRMPKPGALNFNDFLYKLKIGGEIVEPLRVFVTDKEYLKYFVRACVGDKYNVRTIAIIRKATDVEQCQFPPSCCIKPTHASGHVIFRRNAEDVPYDQIKSWFKINYYKRGREANYKYLTPKIIVEPIVFDNVNNEDYKIFCYNGIPKIIQVDVDRYSNHTRKYFDAKWNVLPFSMIYPKAGKFVPPPANLDEMLNVAAKLSELFSFIRIDLYTDGKEIFVGEITNCHENARANFIPPSSEHEISKLIFSN